MNHVMNMDSWKAASNTGSAPTCPVCVYRWVRWHRLQSSRMKKHKSNPSAQEGGFLLFFSLLTIMPSNFHVLLTLFPWSGILFSDINTHPVFPQLVRSMSWHQPVSPCQTERDRTTTVPVWRPHFEHAEAEKKSDNSLSGKLEQSNASLAGETSLKRHRAPNGKNNSVNKRRQPVQELQCKLSNEWSFLLTCCTTIQWYDDLYPTRICMCNFTNCDVTVVSRKQNSTESLGH